MIKEFEVKIADEVLIDLQRRLENSRWIADDKTMDWQYGTNISYLKELVDYWKNTFSWRNVEDKINSFPNYMADIDGFQIHFIHIKSKAKRSIPLIITHGWPGSFLEMLHLIPMLTEDEVFSFDLVIPSLPGFGFSSLSTPHGCSSRTVASLWKKLMNELGYHRFAVQGGDIGAGVSSYIGLLYPEHVIGIHLNYIPGSYKPYIDLEKSELEEIVIYRKDAAEWYSREGAYSFLQSTKPATPAYGLNDSPLGLCAWILEKFMSWSDNDSDIEHVFSKDELLANITLYWVSQSIYTSFCIYNENSKEPFHLKKGEFISPPLCFAKFPKELPTPPHALVGKGYNIKEWVEMPRGGHFAALEQPTLLAESIKSFFMKLA
ncbi:epoxide hydrolase family protein [Olivibacter domesticus]|uniref:Pimeloyl-ACP methyl ester carboxylesterase n=1 Tax=Olivibacter domesticus TaxID=407022 RepID=A0A1H7H7F2_OLID1|nr:epoxide hydrolase family protein [Olivibacter domesticus]SEK46158.1 Pimeloyl-ACP methyl ester carboxylesterase [Olivibacter domesticus]